MQWFGYRPFAYVCREGVRIETPIGEPCLWCEEAIGPDETGFLIHVIGAEETKLLPVHSECNFHRIVGGIYHQQRRCMCFGGELCGDPPELTTREAARLAMEYYDRIRGMR